MHEVSVPFDFLLHHLHLPSLIPHQPQAVPATLQTPRGYCALRYKEMVSTDESFSNTKREALVDYQTLQAVNEVRASQVTTLALISTNLSVQVS